MSYNNPTSEDCDGGNCEGVPGGTCDNRFIFCVRERGSSVCLVTVSSNDDIESDSLTFTPSELSDLDLANPVVFNSVPVEVSPVTTHMA